MNNIKNTKSTFQLRGIISGLEGNKKNFGYECGVLDKGNSAGKEYNKIRFYIQTSKNNKIPVELFGIVKEKVCFYSKQKKDSKMIPWNNRLTAKIEGYEYIIAEFDLIEKIKKDFKDGNSVFVNGEFQFSEYEDNQGNKKNQTRYLIKTIYSTKEDLTNDDFEKKDFEEKNTFQQEIIINSVDEVVADKKTYVNAYVHDFKGIHNTTFVIESNKDTQKLKNSFKTLRLGDFIKIHGVINYQVEKYMKKGGDWGDEPIINVNKSLEIKGADPATLERKMYTETDLIVKKENVPDNLEEEKKLGFKL
jgi:hypothetical protein